jgi:dTDP-4-dehydrorhamnose reductase
VKLLVLGPGGQLGHDVIAAARSAGHTVDALPRADLDLGAAGEDAGQDAGSADEAFRAHDFDALINCAAYTRVDDAEDDAGAAFAVNASAPRRLARACAARGARLVHVSTDYVFDGMSRRPYREGDIPGPLNVYGASKLTGEALARATLPEATLIVRTASLFGVAGARRAASGQGGNFVETMIRHAGRAGLLTVVEDIVMSPTSTADLAHAILTLLQVGADPGIYHVVNQGQASWYDFARMIVDAAGIEAEVRPIRADQYPTRARRPAFSALDTEKAAAAGCDLRPWQDALTDYIARRGSAL